MYSTYGCGSLLKIVVKKDSSNHHVLQEFTMLQICVMVSTLLVYVGRSVTSRSTGTQYIRF